MSSLTLTNLPLEIRLEIYRHLLPTCADILLAPGYKAIYNDDESLDLVETNLVALRHDGQACHPAILRTNHRIYSEAVGIMYSRTFTMTVSMNGVEFLHFDPIPSSFPFHRAKAIRVHVLTSPHPVVYVPLALTGSLGHLSHKAFFDNLHCAIDTLSSLTSPSRPLRQLVIDASDTNAASGLWGMEPDRNEKALELLLCVFKEQGRNVRSCEVRLPWWARGCEKSLRLARECGKAVMERKGERREGMEVEGEEGEGHGVQEQDVEPAVVVQERLLGSKLQGGPTYTEWGERWIEVDRASILQVHFLIIVLVMFARSAFRIAQPLKHNARRYATEGASSGGSNTLLYGGLGAAVLGGGGYYYFSQSPSAASKILPPPAEHKDDSDAQNKGKPLNSVFKGGDQGFVSLLLENVEEINHNTKKLRFALPEKDDVSGLHVASALLTMYKGPDMEKPVLRPYTPTSDEEDQGHLDLIVKKYPNGPMSTHMHNMNPGQRLNFKGPLPKYPWSENKHDHIALIAGGTGITPMYQLCRAIFKNPSDRTKVTLVFGNVSEEDILLKHEFQALENEYPQRFKAFYVLNTPPDGWAQGKGHITKELLKTVLPEPKEENIKVFVCGPPGLYKAISGLKPKPQDQGELEGYLKEMGYSKEQVYKF